MIPPCVSRCGCRQDAVFRLFSSSGKNGSPFAVGWLAAGRRVGFVEVSCESVAIWLSCSRVGGSALLTPEPSRLKAMILRLLLRLLLVAGALDTPCAEVLEALACQGASNQDCYVVKCY